MACLNCNFGCFTIGKEIKYDGEIIENSTRGLFDVISSGHLITGVLIFKALF